MKEVPEISSKKPFRVLRAALWHLKQGGVPQLRQWGARKLGIDYAINYAKVLHENQRQLQDEVRDIERKYTEGLHETKRLQEERLGSLNRDHEAKIAELATTYATAVSQFQVKQEGLFASLKSEYESGFYELKEACDDDHIRIESDRHEACATVSAEQQTVIEDLRSHNARISRELENLTNEHHRLKAKVFSNASQTGLTPEDEVREDEFRSLVQGLLALGHTLPLLRLVKNFPALPGLNLTELRKLGRVLNTAGYWRLLTRVQELIVEKSRKESDQRALNRTFSTISAFESPLRTIEPKISGAYNPSGPVIHVAGKGLLDVQTGYTLRTAYTVRAQQQIGIPTLVALQPGSSAVEVDSITHSWFQKVQYVRLPGKSRNRTFLTPWLANYVDELEALVQEEHPSVLHAHSDFLNGAAAVIVGHRNGIPVIYESRGFWEESWLSRLGDKLRLGMQPIEALEDYGLPDAYTLRRHAELLVREGADAVITLADVMQKHIEQEHQPSELHSLNVVPNAVDPDEFVPRPADENLAADLGIAERAVVIGYVTSMVEYEGVDILLNGFAHLRRQSPELNVHLLLVGDGPVLGGLKELASELGIESWVTFTGQVPHQDVGRFYSLIDIFVIPRRPTTVSQLVTPLKPFEAMSMAKAVVVSSVSALEEIASKSQAAYSFTPNDPYDLARTLHHLVIDEDQRTKLGEAARKWVERYRSWRSNGEKTLKIYRSLGAEWLQIQDDANFHWVEAILSHLRDTPAPSTGWFVLKKPTETPEVVMRDGWRYEDFPRIQLDCSIEWEQYPEINRSLAFWLQSWVFMDAFVADGRTPNLQETKFLLNVVRDWDESRLATLRSLEPDESMAYYDMALALRVPRLLILISVVDQHDDTRHEIPWLVHLLLSERQALRKDASFAPHTNHGFYTASSQLHLEKYLPELPDHGLIWAQANARMNLLIRSQFSEDGGHLEHSPGYHQLLLSSFMAAVEDGLIADEDMVARLQRAQHVLGWMIQPNGELVPMGDTEPSKPTQEIAATEASTEWIRSDGTAGTASNSELLVLPDSGYVFVRSPQPEKPGSRIDSSYLAFQGGFHSRAHKHADDLSLVWFDRGQEILIDGGRWGYGPLLPPASPFREEGHYYAAPERQYVESVRAHNTVEVNRRIHDRRRAPYGSAIIDVERAAEVFVIKSKAPHDYYSHERVVKLRPGKSLKIHDFLEASSDEEHHARAWFLLNGDLELLGHDTNVVRFRMPGGEILLLRSHSVISTPIKGSKEPLTGWRSASSGSLEPAWSVSVERTFVRTGIIESLYEILL